MADQLSGIAIIICIAFGVLTFILLFIFAKRQIMRFALKSRRGPHVPIGHGASKVLTQDIDKYLDVVNEIAYEPKLSKTDCNDININENDINQSSLFYRIKAVDTLSELEETIAAADPHKVRHPGHDLRIYLHYLMRTGVLVGIDSITVHKFVDLYEHARHDPSMFGIDEYTQYRNLLNNLEKHISQQRNPQRIEIKQTDSKTTSALDITKQLSNGNPIPILRRHPSIITIKDSDDKKNDCYINDQTEPLTRDKV